MTTVSFEEKTYAWSTLDKIGIAAVVAFIILIVKTLYYATWGLLGFGFVGMGLAWVGVSLFCSTNHFVDTNWRGEKQYERSWTTRGWYSFWAAVIVLSTVLTFLFWSGDGVYVAGKTTTVSQVYLVAVPFVEHIDYAASEYSFTRSDELSVSIPVDAHHTLVAEVSATGFVLDSRDRVGLERMLITRTQTSQAPGTDIRRELASIVESATRAELANWPIKRLDAAGGTLVLTNGIGTRVINDEISRLHLRWQDGMLSISTYMQFNT